MPRTEALTRYSRTNWRRVAAWSLLVTAVSVALALGFSTYHRSVVNRRIIEHRGPPCVRQKDGKPSTGCKRIARLVAEQCRATPKLCAPLVRVIVVTPEGRLLVRRELRRQLAAVRRRAARHGGTVPDRPGAPVPSSPSSPTPGVGGGPGAGAPPSPVAPPPAAPSLPAPPRPPSVPSPNDVVRDPVGAVGGLTCQLGVCLPPPPAALPPFP